MVLALARAHGGCSERRRGASRGRPGRKFTGRGARKKKSAANPPCFAGNILGGLPGETDRPAGAGGAII